jgi:hypothetical protein
VKQRLLGFDSFKKQSNGNLIKNDASSAMQVTSPLKGSVLSFNYSPDRNESKNKKI